MVSSNTVTGTSYTVTGLTQGTQYWFVVDAQNADNIWTSGCNSVTGTTAASGPSIVSAVVQDADDQRLIITFSAALNTSTPPDIADFSFAHGTVTGSISFGSTTTVQVDRATSFAPLEVETFSYTPNSDVSKRLKSASTSAEVAAVVNHAITNNVV